MIFTRPLLRAAAFAVSLSAAAAADAEASPSLSIHEVVDRCESGEPSLMAVSDLYGETHCLVAAPIVGSAMVRDVTSGEGRDGRFWKWELTEPGRQRLADFTASHVGDRIGYLFDDKLIGGPATIMEPIVGPRASMTLYSPDWEFVRDRLQKKMP